MCCRSTVYRIVVFVVTAAWLGGSTLYGQQCDTCGDLNPQGCIGCQSFLRDCAPRPTDPSSEHSTDPDGRMATSPDTPLPEVDPNDLVTSPAPSVPSSPSLNDLAALSSNYGAAQGDQFAVPSMIGDFFAGGYQYSIFNGATAATAGGDRRMKFSDNNSPFPQNRLFFNYHNFHNAVIDINGADQNLHRFTFGFERMFRDGWSSWEIRMPFAATVGAVQTLGVNDTTTTEFGNISLALKRLLYRGPCFSVAAGMGIVFPTGRDNVFSTTGAAGTAPDVVFENDAVHLQPFVGVYAPRGRWFHQFFAQLDFDVNGNTVRHLGTEGTLQDQTYLFLDYSVGYWLFRNQCHRRIQSLAPMFEIHYSTTTQEQDYGPFGNDLFVVDPTRSLLHLTGGLFLELSRLTSLKVAAIAPVRDGSDKFFDAEFGLQLTRRY